MHKFIRECLCSLVIFLSALFVFPEWAASSEKTDAVVKVFVTSNKMDYYRPWQSKGIQSSAASGAIIAGNRILTNAHVVADQTFIQVKKNRDPKRYTAKLLTLGNDCDLAILTVEDEGFFNNTTSLEVGELPQLRDSVTVLGYPQGGEKLSITEGVISRIEVNSYAQSTRKLLAVQIDAAINPGNSGGPVLQNGKLVGIVMQSFQPGQNIGYVIPTPVIEHFLEDINDGRYEGFPLLGIHFTNTENDSLRKFYKVEGIEGGVFVTRVLPYSPADGKLKEGDVILKVDGITIGEDGTFEFRKGERLEMPYLITKHQINEEASFKIIRDGKEKRLSVQLKPFATLVPDPDYFRKPPYYIYGGFVFTVLSSDLLRAWGKGWWEKAPLDLVYHSLGAGQMNLQRRKELVVLLHVLPDDINVGYHGYGNEIVTKINGKAFVSFQEFVSLLRKSQKEDRYTVITTEKNAPLIIDNSNIEEVNEKIINRNNIPSQYSDDVAGWLETKQKD